MLTVLFASGKPYATHDLRDNGLYRYVSLCRRSEDGAWKSKDGSVKCQLRSYELRTTNDADLRMFIETLREFVDDRTTLIHIVTMPESLPEPPGGLTYCECSLSLCDWCRERNTRNTKDK
jgi:hypothetical protein